jgi:hypothetical protein
MKLANVKAPVRKANEKVKASKKDFKRLCNTMDEADELFSKLIKIGADPSYHQTPNGKYVVEFTL